MKKRITLLAIVFLALAKFAGAEIKRIDYNADENVTYVTYAFVKCDNPWKIYKIFFPGPVKLAKVKARIMEPNGIKNPRRIPIGKEIVISGADLNHLVPKVEVRENQNHNNEDLLVLSERIERLEKEVIEFANKNVELQERITSLTEDINAGRIEQEKAGSGLRKLSKLLVIALIGFGILFLVVIALAILIWRTIRPRDRVIRSNAALMLFVILFLASCAGPKMVMQNVNTGVSQAGVEHAMLIEPHQSLGLEPTNAIREGNFSTFLVAFPLRLFGEYFPGRLRWNAWVVQADGSESFGQVIFSGVHPSGEYFGTLVADGQKVSGHAAILSTACDYIYSLEGRETSVEREKFLTDPAYRAEMIREVSGGVSLASVSQVNGFQEVIKSWNQVQYPEGYLLSPVGVEEVAAIRGINPQYSYFQKLVGTGKFRVSPIPHPVGFAISNSLGIVMDLIGAGDAPTTGWDYNSQLPNRRNMAFIIEYLLMLAKKEIQLRNQFNLKLIEARDAPRR